MLIEVLFVPGCPNHAPAVERLRKVLRSEAIIASIQEIAVKDEVMARLLKFPGSPTVRVNGRDVESKLQWSYGLACRLYSDRTGVPSIETLQRAVARAQSDQV
ncbi:MAG: hypothetical protein WBC78_11165 [Candidatus Sulfotelmatobacter sp.]